MARDQPSEIRFDVKGGGEVDVRQYSSLEKLVGILRGLLVERLARCEDDGALLPASAVTDIDATLVTEIDANERDRVDVKEEPILVMESVDLEGKTEVCVQRSLVVGLLHELRDQGVQVFFITAREDMWDAETRRQLADTCRFDTTDGKGDDQVLHFPSRHPDAEDEAYEDKFWCFKESARRVVSQMTDMVLAIGDRAWDATSLEVARRMAVGFGYVDDDGDPDLDSLDASPEHYLITHRWGCGRTTFGVKLSDFESESILK